MARDLIPPPSPAGRPVAPGTPPPTHLRRAAAGAGGRGAARRRRSSRSSTSRRPSTATGSGSWPARSAVSCWSRSRSRSRVFAYSGNGGDDYGMHRELVHVAAAGRVAAGRRGGDRHARRRPVQAPERRPAPARCSRCSRASCRSRSRPARSPDLTGDTVVYRWPAWAPGGSIEGEASVARGARRLPRGAGARALHVPLPAGRRERDGDDPAAAAGRRHHGRRRRGRTQAAAGDQEAAAQLADARAAAEGTLPRDLLPPGRPEVRAAGPARRDGPGGRPEREDDHQGRGRRHQPARPVQPVHVRESRQARASSCDRCRSRPDLRTVCGLRAPARDPQYARVRVLDVRTRTAGEPGYAKYPPMPVVRCAGFEPPTRGGDRASPAPRGGSSPAA